MEKESVTPSAELVSELRGLTVQSKYISDNAAGSSRSHSELDGFCVAFADS